MAGSLLERGRVTENPQCHGVHAAEFKTASGFYDDVATLSAHTHTYTCIQYTFNLCIHIGVHTCIDHTCYMRMHIQIYTMTFMQKKTYALYIYKYICREYASGLLMFTSWFDGFHRLLFVCFTGCPTGPGVSKSPLSRMASPVSTGGVLNPMPFLGLEGARGVMSWYNFGDKW